LSPKKREAMASITTPESARMTFTPPSNPEVTPQIRRIWVQRDGFIEYKTWFIFDWEVTGSALGKLANFLRTEQHRFHQTDATPEQLRTAASDYSFVNTKRPELPPRLTAIPGSVLEGMGTQLVTKGRATYGDSVGGLAPSMTGDIDAELRKRLAPDDKVLFSPGVLARLRCKIQDEPYYLFQLAVKNLRKTGSIFYKAVGGHLKFHPSFEKVIHDLNLDVKKSSQVQDSRDLVFRVRGDRLGTVIDLFERETLGSARENLFLPPITSMCQELREEVGPVDTSDGVSLFTDAEMWRDFISGR
jgi:hypothetical protein